MYEIPVLGSDFISGVDSIDLTQLNTSILLLVLYLGYPDCHAGN